MAVTTDEVAPLITRQALTLGEGMTFRQGMIPLPRKTAMITLKAPCAREAKARLAIIVYADGEEYRCDDAGYGGGQLSYTLPYGFFGRREGCPQRLGEAVHDFWASLEVDCLEGVIEADLEAFILEADAPHATFHSSVAWDATSCALSTVDSATMSVPHTATGANKAALICTYNGKAGGVPATAATSFTATYGGNNATVISGWYQQPFYALAMGGLYVLDAGMPAGAQTVTATQVGGSGTVSEKAISVTSMTGVNQSTPIGTAAITSGLPGTNTISVTVAGTTADGLLVDTVLFYSAAITVVAPQNQRFNEYAVTIAFTGWAVSTKLSSAGGVMSWTRAAGDEFVYGAVEFKASPVSTILTPNVVEALVVGDVRSTPFP